MSIVTIDPVPQRPVERARAGGPTPAGAGGPAAPHAADGCHSGPEIPPSFRIRQKWTARKIAVTSGSSMMWST